MDVCGPDWVIARTEDMEEDAAVVGGCLVAEALSRVAFPSSQETGQGED